MTEDMVSGYYLTEPSDRLILLSNGRFKIDIGTIKDTVLHVFQWTKTASGHWQLNKKTVSLTVDNPEYKSWNLTFHATGNKLTCVQNSKVYKKTTRPEDPIYSLKIGKEPNKTLRDTLFKRGDIIKIPEVVYVLDGNGTENDDSLKIVANFLISHPKLVVEIGSHTDSRGYAESNLDLSEKRAESVKNYLISKFTVNPNQINSKGYGETQPLVPDTEILKATTKQEKEALHQINRRTIMTVIKVY